MAGASHQSVLPAAAARASRATVRDSGLKKQVQEAGFDSSRARDDAGQVEHADSGRGGNALANGSHRHSVNSGSVPSLWQRFVGAMTLVGTFNELYSDFLQRFGLL